MGELNCCQEFIEDEILETQDNNYYYYYNNENDNENENTKENTKEKTKIKDKYPHDSEPAYRFKKKKKIK